LSTVLARHVLARGVLLALGAIVVPLVAAVGGIGPAEAGLHGFGGAEAGLHAAGYDARILALALALALAGEILGRYLFFVSVVPRHLAAPYLAAASEAV
jgi:hypothetical protein